MRFFTAALTIAAVCASAAAASAAPARISDVQYIAANRCLGIESAKNLGATDVDALRQLVKSQDWGREGFVQDKADQAREDGQREASRSGAENNLRLTGERDGVCRALASTTTASTSAGGSHNMMQ
jgi:hypothetical protein